MKLLTIFALLLAPLTNAFPSDCGDQSGWFHCPAYHSQPEMILLRITQVSTTKKEMTITDYYSAYGVEPFVYQISESGVLDPDGFIGRCDEYKNKPAMLFFEKDRDPVTTGTYTFINDQNNLEGVVNGITKIICTRGMNSPSGSR